MSDIFISYANEDQPCAQMLAEAFEAQGWSIFWDRTIPIGETWRGVIGKELSEARCVVVLWSKASITSKWVQEEADDGEKRGVLVPVLIAKVVPPIGFRSIQAADLSDWVATEPTLAFHRLIADVTALIGRPPAEAENERRPAEAERVRRAEVERQSFKPQVKGEPDEERARPPGRSKRIAPLAALCVGLVLLAIGGTWYVQEERHENQRQRQPGEIAHGPRRAAEEAAPTVAEQRKAEEAHRVAQEERKAAAQAAEAQLGLTRAERRDVQRVLRLHGFKIPTFDGVFGPTTRHAIRAWQRTVGKQATGYLESKEQYVRLRRAGRQKASAMPSSSAIPTRKFTIPYAAISVDGGQRDWKGIEPVYVGLERDQDPRAALPGTDLRAFYMAMNGRYLYLAMTLFDGMPDPRHETMYFFVAIQRPFEIDLAGDMDAAAAFASGRWHVWTNERAQRGEPAREGTHYPSHFAASSPNFVEWKVPLSDIGNIHGRFVRAYIHVAGKHVSDDAVPGIELNVD